MTDEITEMASSVTSKVEAVRRFFADSKAKNHPIKEHPVSKQEEYVRDLYLEMLCVVSQYQNGNPENAFILVKRIMASCDETQSLQEYIKRSLEITQERIAEFIKQCKDNELCEIFMVDSMLLSCSNGSPNIMQVLFLTEFGDMLGFDKDKMVELSKFALTILKQDSEEYQSLLKQENAYVQVNLLGYAKEFVSGLLIFTEKKIYYYTKELSNHPFEKELNLSNVDEVIIENFTFANDTIVINDVKKLQIINCVFRDYEKKNNFGYCEKLVINARNVDLIIIDRSIFKYCICRGKGTAPLRLISVTNLIIKDSRFDNIQNPVGYYDSCTSGGVLYFSGHSMSEILIDHCEFNNCSVGGDNCAAIIYKKSLKNARINYSLFSRCKGSYLFGDYVFPLQEEHNQYVDCAPTKKR